MVEVETAHEELVRLAVAGMLGDDHAGDGLEQLPLTQQRAQAQVSRADMSLRRGRCHPAQVIHAPHDAHDRQRTHPP